MTARTLFDPQDISKRANALFTGDMRFNVHPFAWHQNRGNIPGDETLHQTYKANEPLSSIDQDRLLADREGEWATGKVAEHNFGRDAPGYGDIGRLTRGEAASGKFVPQPVSGETFKDRLLSRARWPESRNIQDRRGERDIRQDYTIDEWVKKTR